jgi:serine/threonine-protein kinase
LAALGSSAFGEKVANFDSRSMPTANRKPVDIPTSAKLIQVVGRYALYDVIGRGGMASVHLARLLGPVGFTRTVAIKRLHPQYASDPEFVSMFLDEARLAARIRHPNVVQTLDVVASDGDLFLVMELVQGETLSRLVRAARERQEKIPPRIVGAIISGLLHGLHAAHEACNTRGEPLGLVHRDISPQNVLVGMDGVARVLDFGVAKAIGRVQHSHSGQLKGKLAYMAPEQLLGKIGRAADIYAASVVLWEALTCVRLFDGEDQAMVLSKLMDRKVESPSRLVSGLSKEIDHVVLRGLSVNPEDRYSTARDMAREVETHIGVATASEVGQWVESLAKKGLAERLRQVAEIENVEIDSISSTCLSLETPLPRFDLPRESAASMVEPAPKPRATEADIEVELPNRPRWPPRPVLAWAVLAIVLVAGLSIGWAHRRQESGAKAYGAQPTVLVHPLDPPAPPDPQVLVERPPLPMPEPEVKRAAPPRPMRVVSPRVSDRARAPTPASSPDCDVPYTLDATGIRHPRLECL